MQNNRDVYTMPTGKTIKTSTISLDDLLMESDQTRELERTIKLSKQNKYEQMNGDNRTSFQLQEIPRQYVNTGQVEITEEDLEIENLINGEGSSTLQQLLKSLEDKNDYMLDFEEDRSSLQKIIEEEHEEKKQEEPAQYIIDYVDQFEKQPYTFLAISAQQEHESFLFTHYEEQLRKERIETFKQLTDVKQKQIQKVQNQLSFLETKLKQSHRCLQYHCDAQREYLTVGFSRASIVLFILKCPIAFTAGQDIVLPQDSTIKQSPVVSLEFTDNGVYLLSCTQEAQFLYYSLVTPTNPKLLKTFSQVHGASPLAFQIFGEQLISHNYLNFISCDLDGVVQTNRIKQQTFSYGMEKNILLNKTSGIIHQLCRQQVKFPHLNLTIEAVATASRDSVTVIAVEPFIDMVFKRENPYPVPSLVKWHSSQNATYLMIANGNELLLVAMQCNRDSKKVDLKFEIHSHLILKEDSKIDCLHWLSENIIFTKVDKLQYYLLDTSRFQSGDSSSGYNETTFKRSLIAQAVLETEIADQKYTLEGQQLSLYTNTIVSKQNKMLFLESSSNTSRFYFLFRQLSVWHEFIEMKIDSRDWNYCLALLLQMYNGNARYFAQLPLNDFKRKQMMLPYMNEFIIRYIQYVSEFDRKGDNLKQEQESWKNNTTRAIEFLIKAESPTFLFTSLRALLNKLNKDEIFLDSLEPFILRNEIKVIPKEALKDVFTNLKRNRKLQTLKQLIINLDIDTLDSGQIVTICIEFNLYSPLMYICPRQDEDYYTPIVKMFATYTNLLKEFENTKGSTLQEINTNSKLNEQNHIMQFWQDQEISHPHTSQEMLKEIKLQGYRCLWYIHLCFKGELFPHDNIPRESWGRVLLNLMLWVFAEETLTVLLNLNAYVTFNEILQLFQKPQMDALKQNKDETMLILQTSYKRNSNQNSGMTIADVIVEVLSHQITQVKYKEIFNLFLSEVLNLIPDLHLDYAMPAIEHMLKHPYQNLKQECLKQSYMFLNNNKQMPTNDDSEAIQIIKENTICSYLMLNKKLFDKHLLDDILQSSSESPFVEVRCQVFYMRNQYNQCIDQLIHSTQQHQRIKVFEYIFRFFRTIQDVKQLQSLMKHLLQNVRELVLIDLEKVSVLLDHYQENDFKEAISKLNEFPQLKYRLLQKIVQKKRANKETLEDKLMVEYFELTCKLTPERAQEELRYGDFPQDQCLSICRKYKIQAGEAYLMEKSGSVVDAINLYFDIFIDNLSSLFKNESALLAHQKQLTDYMMKKIHSCLDICRENNKKGDEESETNWFLLIQRITKLRYKYFYSQQGKNVYLCLNEVYQTILQEVLNKVELKSVLQNLESLIGNFSLDDVKSTFQQLLNGYSYELLLLKQTLFMVIEDVQRMDQVLYTQQSRGVRLLPNPQEHRKCYIHVLCEQLVPYDEYKANQSCTSCSNQPEQQISVNIHLAEQKSKLQNQKKRISSDDTPQQPQQESSEEDEHYDLQSNKRELKSQKMNKWKEYDFNTQKYKGSWVDS